MNQDTTGRNLYWQYRIRERTLLELSHLYRIPPSTLSRQFRQTDERMLKLHGLRWFLEILRVAMPVKHEIVCKYATEHNLTRVQALAKLECTVSAYCEEKRKDPVRFLRRKLTSKMVTREPITGNRTVPATISRTNLSRRNCLRRTERNP